MLQVKQLQQVWGFVFVFVLFLNFMPVRCKGQELLHLSSIICDVLISKTVLGSLMNCLHCQYFLFILPVRSLQTELSASVIAELCHVGQK